MPLNSPYRIQLTREERRELEARARSVSIEMSRLVLLAAQGLSNNDCRAVGYPTAKQVAQALLRNASPASKELRGHFSPRVRRRIACERPGCRSRGGRSRSCQARGLPRISGSWCGAGWMPMRIAAGSFPGTRDLPNVRPHLGSLRGPLERPPVGAARLVITKRPAFKPASGAMPPRPCARRA